MTKIYDVAIITLGCRTNQYESELIAKKLIENNISVSLNFAKASYYILNTCSITATADKKSRQLISRVLKLNNDAKIIVLGCSSERDKDCFKDKPNVIFIGGTQNKLAAAELLIIKIKANAVKDNSAENVKDNGASSIKDSISNIKNINASPVFGVRQHLKIQDGCDNFCTYCIIPYLRGRSISRPLNDIVAEARQLSDNCKEIVVTGINMSDYKVDNKCALTQLVLALSSINSRFRFGSLECNVISQEFINACKLTNNFCPHFHLSMQSGCDQTLKDMNRHYTAKQFIEKVNLIKQNFKNPFIACDIIVGFPTETDDNFNETINTVKECQFSNMHIFPYSKREGTQAGKLAQLPPAIVKQREEVLTELNNFYSLQFKNKLLNSSVNVLIEEYDLASNISSGFSENYVKVYINEKLELNTLISVTLTKLYKDGFEAKINS